MTNADLQLVLASTKVGKGIPEVLRAVAEALNKVEVEYAVAGALALGQYANARYTKDIDVLVMEDSRETVKLAMRALGYQKLQELDYQLQYKDPATGVEIDFLLGELDPEQSAIEDSVRADVLGVKQVALIRPYYLLWMYCLSDLKKHEVDGIAMIHGGQVDLALTRRLMGYAHDTTAQAQLNTLSTLASSEKAVTYSTTTAKRVARKKKPQA